MSRTTFGADCPTCGKRPYLRLTTDGNGKHREELLSGCEHERQRRGICKTCQRPVDGKVGKAKYCAPCRVLAVKEQNRRSAEKHREKRREAGRERWRRLAQERPDYVKNRHKTDAERKRRAEYQRNRRAAMKPGSPEYEARLAAQRADYEKHREKRKEAARRRYHANAERYRAAAREQSKFRTRRARALREAARRAAPPEKQPKAA